MLCRGDECSSIFQSVSAAVRFSRWSGLRRKNPEQASRLPPNNKITNVNYEPGRKYPKKLKFNPNPTKKP